MFTLCYDGYKFGFSLGWYSFGTSVLCLYWVMLGTSLGLALGGKVFGPSVYTGLSWEHVWVDFISFVSIYVDENKVNFPV